MTTTRLSFSIKEAAEVTGVSQDTIRAAIARNDLPRHFAGTKQLILVADLTAWLESLPTSRRSA